MTDNNNSTTNVQTENFICPNCGGGMRHDVRRNQFLCSSCGYEGEVHAENNTVDEWDFSEYHNREAQSVAFSGMAVSNCINCGSQITFLEHETATVCPMCGSSQFSEAKQKAGIPPEGIIPFRVDKQEAGQKFREWVKGLWFAPNKLKKSYQEGNLNGRFVPFWTYDAKVVATYTGEGGRYRKVRDSEGEEHTETDWFRTNGVVQKSFDDILVLASSGEGAKDTALVGPYDTINDLLPYAPEYLAGYQAELYTIKADVGFEEAKDEINSTIRSLASSDIQRRFDTSRSININPVYSDITYKHVLLPVWSSVFGYSGKTYRYLVNGVNGNVYGQHPYSIPKIVGAIVVAIIIIFGVIGIFAGGDEASANGSTQEMIVEHVCQTYMEAPLQETYFISTNL